MAAEVRPLGAALQPLAERDKGDDDRRRLEIEMGGAGGKLPGASRTRVE